MNQLNNIIDIMSCNYKLAVELIISQDVNVDDLIEKLVDRLYEGTASLEFLNLIKLNQNAVTIGFSVKGFDGTWFDNDVRKKLMRNLNNKSGLIGTHKVYFKKNFKRKMTDYLYHTLKKEVNDRIK
tara:strand:- start:2018 stop:2395 length:378 start_codon:yes stop_codon:yes gene_type:complete